MYKMKKIILATIVLLVSSAGFTQQQMYYYPPEKFDFSELVDAKKYLNHLITGNAPALYHLEVVRVSSGRYPAGEQIKPYQYQTMLNHGGDFLYVTTVELGYGVSSVVTVNGRIVPLTSVVGRAFLCLLTSGEIRECSIGETIQGFLYVWDVTKYGTGEFTYAQRASDTSPRTFSRKIYIN